MPSVWSRQSTVQKNDSQRVDTFEDHDETSEEDTMPPKNPIHTLHNSKQVLHSHEDQDSVAGGSHFESESVEKQQRAHLLKQGQLRHESGRLTTRHGSSHKLTADYSRHSHQGGLNNNNRNGGEQEKPH